MTVGGQMTEFYGGEWAFLAPPHKYKLGRPNTPYNLRDGSLFFPG